MVDRRQFLSILLAPALFAQARAAGPIVLPPPQLDIGMPLMHALSERRSSRAFSSRPLPAQTVSNLLWAAFGVNRRDSGRRTAPSAHNWQEIDIYVTLAEGAYLYQPKSHALSLVAAEDLRSQTGLQDFPGRAPLNLVYVVDFSRMGGASRQDREFYAATDCGFIAQNAYLYCASEGLATVVRGFVDRETLGRALGLGREQRVILAQTVGYPG